MQVRNQSIHTGEYLRALMDAGLIVDEELFAQIGELWMFRRHTERY